MSTQLASPATNQRRKRHDSFLSQASSIFSFKTVKSHFSASSEKKRRGHSLSGINVTVDQIKPHVLDAFEEYPLLYHVKDVERINRSDIFIERFIEEYQSRKRNNWEEILTTILDSLKWRMDFGVNDLNAKMFPKEFYDLKVFSVAQIAPKEFMVYTIARRFRKIDGIQEQILKFLIYCFESKVEEYGEDIKITVFCDVSNCGLAQVDIKLFLQGIPIVIKNYPAIAQHAYIYELPWLLRPVAKLLISLLPAKCGSMVDFVSRSDYSKVVPRDKLPNFMGGTVEPTEFEPVDGCVTIEELGEEIGLSVDQVKKAKKVVRELMKEMEKERKYKK